MRVLDRSKLEPWALVLGNAEQLAGEERHMRAFYRTHHGNKGEPTEEELVAYHHKNQVRRADFKWLQDNLPVGTVFDHLGAACMVLGHAMSGGEVGSRAVAELDVQVAGGVERQTRSVAQLRAMLEPGYVVTRESLHA